ncbi:MAG TPA: PHP domain-containing protein [Clostridia bacterium]|nr:PHP domain-containing protein [Clostridia bacterium]
MIYYDDCIEGLNGGDQGTRLSSLRRLKEGMDSGKIPRPKGMGYINNHIHTTYSFSPYSPGKAVWMAFNSGLATAGIMDHDSVSGAGEFIEAGRILGIATTVGIECRVDFSSTPLRGRRINNPDQDSIAYMAIHGIPHTQIQKVTDFFAPYTAERNKRNRAMTRNINRIMEPFDIELDFDREITPISQYGDGGSITERHLLFALSLKLVQKFGRGQELIEFLTRRIGIRIKSPILDHLTDKDNIFYEYDLLGLLKSDLVERIYIDATGECPDVREVIAFSKDIGAIPAYAYLGDVGDSVTGDKKPQKFEDDYLDLLFKVIKDLGFDAVTYMPTRNTMEQLKRVKDLCLSYGFFEISGEDINSPRQSFVCEILNNPIFENLIDSTWALIGHEAAATDDLSEGMFTDDTASRYPDLHRRIAVYREIGLNLP